jgi:mono/diheme cytochrome c family protein
MELEAGYHPFEAHFTRLPGLALLDLLWQGPSFAREPVPPDALAHLTRREPLALMANRKIEAGRLLAEEANCLRCHLPSDSDKMSGGLRESPAPDLSEIGKRARPGYLERWLDAPRKFRPGTLMPELFPPGEEGRAERHAVVRYLTSLGGPCLDSAEKGSPASGGRLFLRVGCVACHATDGESGDRPKANFYQTPRLTPLRGMGSKTTARHLASFLKDPLALRPAGRMPSLSLSDREAADLAAFLCSEKLEGVKDDLPTPSKGQLLAAFARVEDRAEELAAFAKLPPPRQWLELGKQLVIDRGCNNCHAIAPEGKPFANVLPSASLDDIRKVEKHNSGCLAPLPPGRDKGGEVPRFGFSAGQRDSLSVFLTRGLSGAGSPAPRQAARLDLQRFNCLACHARDGEGGLPSKIIQQIRLEEKADCDEAVAPPTLTGVGHKLQPEWVKKVLGEGKRARPWLGVRMPEFGAGNVGHLPHGLASLEGAGPEAPPMLPRGREFPEAGRLLVGASGLSCVSCHDIDGIASIGTRAPDLATLTQRVRYSWYRRWLEQPGRMAPGTRMPTVFTEGVSPLKKILAGRADDQTLAMWAYLSQGPGLPLPEGTRLGPK